jgi:hypothetical protein
MCSPGRNREGTRSCRSWVSRRERADLLAHLIAMGDTDEVVRLRLLRAIGDVGRS